MINPVKSFLTHGPLIQPLVGRLWFHQKKMHVSCVTFQPLFGFMCSGHMTCQIW